MYVVACGKASHVIDMSIKEAQEKHGWDNGSALTDIYRKNLKDATDGIEPLTYTDELGLTCLMEDEDGNHVYDRKDAFKMLQAIDHINTYIL